ncbi:MAG: hypothetical protein GF331_18810 [Chitinivibrionales bacterium]|nr:hypothetical protein [Chitinivibrionales bacterium]
MTLLGSNLVGEWTWSRDYFIDHNDSLSHYLFEDARGMNVEVLRTHTLPPSHFVCDLCDRKGMMLLAEMPMTYNYQPFRFASDDAQRYHETAVKVAEAWVEALANHPSVIMWVSTNEPIGDEFFNQAEWDLNTLIPAMKEVDPTRPIMRSGGVTSDVLDMHSYDGWWAGAPGDYNDAVDRALRNRGDVPLMNDEYIAFGPHPTERWLNLSRAEANENNRWQLFEAENAGMKQTEVLRRRGLNGALPYMLHGWTKGNWREDAPTPMYAALRSALAKVAVSLDLDDWNFLPGATRDIDVWLMNDSNEDTKGTITAYVVKGNAEFSTNPKRYRKATEVVKQSHTIPARSRTPHAVTFTMPEQTGEYSLVALLEVDGREPVMSQRKVIVHTEPSAKRAAGKRYHFMGNDTAAAAYVKQRGLDAIVGLAGYKCIMGGDGRDLESRADADVLVVWESAIFNNDNLHISEMVARYLMGGKRVVMMRQRGWRMLDWHWQHSLPPGPNVDYITQPNSSGTMQLDSSTAPRGLWDGLTNNDLLRWNGYRNAMSYECLTGFPSLELSPARLTPTGFVPVSDETVVIESENVVASSFVVDHLDPLHVERRDGKLVAREFPLLRNGRTSLLSTRKAPDGGYRESYAFEVSKAVDGQLWTFEQGRVWASPFKWRIDGGGWTEVSTAVAMRELLSVGPDGSNAPSFGWSMLGSVQLAPGKHTLEVQVTEPKANGHYLLSQDCFLVTPRPSGGEVLARDAGRKPVLARFAAGNGGELVVCQVLLSDRILKTSESYDPLAERFFLNLVSY